MKLNLGCGNDYKQGWVNVDQGNCRKDIDHNIEIVPWPFEDSSATHMYLSHVLEHISRENFVDFVAEMHRVGKAGCVIDIEAPYAGSDNFWTDPTHKMPLTTRTFDFFDPSKALFENGKIYGWDKHPFKVVRAAKVPSEPNGPDVVFTLQVIK